MARARNIKPGFFKNEVLVEMGPFDRLLFIGLWCLADREGRIEDRPKRIKMELFPCDSYDVDHGLNELAINGFIKRYEVNGVRVILIRSFLKHQTPHGTEKDSELPDENGELTVHERNSNGYVCGKKRSNNVNSDSVNVPPPLDNSAETVDPPSHNTLNPDSLNPDLLNKEEPNGSVASKLPTCPTQALIDLYHHHLPELPSVRLLSDKRQKALRTFWRWVLTSKKSDGTPRATNAEEALDWIGSYFNRARSNDFLMGRSGRSGDHSNWTCDLDFLLTEKGKTHVIERT